MTTTHIFSKKDVPEDSVNDIINFLDTEITKREPPKREPPSRSPGPSRGISVSSPRTKGLRRRGLRPRSFGFVADKKDDKEYKKEKKEEKEEEVEIESLALYAADEPRRLFDAEVETSTLAGAAFAFAEMTTPEDKELERIVDEKLHVVFEKGVSQPFFEIRPNRCRHPFLHDQSLEYDLLILSDRKIKLNREVLGAYLEKQDYHKGKIQFHFNDIIQGKLHSITTGNMETGDIILQLADFLSKYDENFVIPLHLPFFEQWKDNGDSKKWGNLSKDWKKKAIANANNVLKYICSKWKYGGMVALETGQGLYQPDGKVLYGLLGDDPDHFTDLVKDKEDKVAIVLDVGHMNLVRDYNYKDHLIRRIREIHFHGNDGKKDLHLLPSPDTLEEYDEISSFLKYFSGQICFETKRGSGMKMLDYLKQMKGLLENLFADAHDLDKLRLRNVKNYLKIRDRQLYKGNIHRELPPASPRSAL